MEAGPTTNRVPRRCEQAALYSVLFVMGADMFFVPLVLPLLADNLHIEVAAAAQIVTVFGLAYAVSSPVLGGILQSRSTRTLILIGLSIAVAASLLSTTATDLGQLMLARGLSGIAAAIVNPTVWARLGTHALAANRSGIVIGGAAVSASGQILGVPLGILLAAARGWHYGFLALAAMFTVAFVNTLLVIRDRSPIPPEPDPNQGSGCRRLALTAGIASWLVPSFAVIVSANIAAQATRIGTYSFAGSIFARKHMVTGATTGILAITAGVGALCGTLVAALTIDRWRRTHSEAALGIVCAAVLVVGVELYLLPSSLLLNILGIGMSSAAGATVFGIGQSYATSHFPGDRSATAWNSSALYIGGAVGSFTLGRTPLGGMAFVAIATTLSGMCLLAFSAAAVRSGATPSLPQQRCSARGSTGGRPGLGPIRRPGWSGWSCRARCDR